MLSDKKSELYRGVHKEALKLFDDQYLVEYEERKQAIADRRFTDIAGAQWEGALGQHYQNKLRFEVNKVQIAITRIINDWRRNRISVKFTSCYGGESSEKLAETCQDIYRADEKFSGAQEAYDTAFDEAVKGGIGAWILRTEYLEKSNEENDQQKIIFEPITDADSRVFFFNSSRQDKADADGCMLLTALPVEKYKEKYGDDALSWDKSKYELNYDWYEPNRVWIAEYFRKETTKSVIYVYVSPVGEEQKYDESEISDELLDYFNATSMNLVRSKTVEKTRIRRYVLSGNKVLEDSGYIAGSELPIVCTYGKRSMINNIERYSGHVRHAKDSQRLKNMQVSKLGEISALSAIEKPIFDITQMTNPVIKQMWADDAVNDNPYLLIESLRDDNGNIVSSAPAGYTKQPDIPPALAALLQVSENDMQDVLGRHQEGEKLRANTSGEAIALVQESLDNQSFIYISNMAKAMARCGAVWLSMSRDVYTEKDRSVRGLSSSGKIDYVKLKQNSIDRNGAEIINNNLKEAYFDVYADVGASYKTRRHATINALTRLLPLATDPQDQKVLSSLILMNMEGEGLDDAREYYRQQLVGMGVIKPTKEDQERMQAMQESAQPDANQAYLLAAAQEKQTASAENEANIKLTQAKTAETMAKAEAEAVDTELKRRQQLIKEIEEM